MTRRVLLVLLLVLGVLTLPGPQASATCGWTVIPSPNRGTEDNQLTDVSVRSATDVWAVGYRGTFDKFLFAQHWNGSAWSWVPVPKPKGISDVYLTGVDTVSADDAWAVGTYIDGSVVRPLVRHWNGTKWMSVAVPKGTADAQLEAVAAVSSRNVWAVGWQGTKTFMLHWNGRAWSKVSGPNPGTYNQLVDVTRVPGTKQLWAVGGYTTATNTLPLMLRRAGGSWTQYTGPFAKTGVLRSVSAVSEGDVWAVGEEQGFNYAIALIEHWNGTSWTKATPVSPSNQPQGNFLYGVSATSASRAFAVGNYSSNGPSVTLAEEWFGGSWGLGSTPPQGSATFWESDFVPGTLQVWAVGQTWGGSRWITLIERYC